MSIGRPVAGGVACMLLPALAAADGLAFKSGREFSSYRPATEGEQIAAIHHRDGEQSMVIAVNIDLEDADSRGLWLLPVPGRPPDIQIDLEDRFPRLAGYDPIRRSKSRLGIAFRIARATQLYPLVLDFLLLSKRSRSTLGSVTVAAEVERWGLRVELLTADDLDELVGHFGAQDVVLGRSDLATLQPYLNEDYSIVATWIASRTELIAEFPEIDERSISVQDRTPCLQVRFPTDEAFYPLRPTATYGDEVVPLRLYIVGCVEPRTSAPLISQVSPRYYKYRASKRGEEGEESGWLQHVPADSMYTLIRDYFTADQFTDDLWFVPAEPPGLSYALKVDAVASSRANIVAVVVLVMVLSYVAGGLAALSIRQRWRRGALIGLWNLLTILGLYIAMRESRFPDRDDPRSRQRLERTYLFYFTVIYLVLCAGLQAAIWYPLL